MSPRPPRPTLFPYTTLFRSSNGPKESPEQEQITAADIILSQVRLRCGHLPQRATPACRTGKWPQRKDRKSTRLNSSHSQISYAVFCLKKKKYIDSGICFGDS